VAAQNRIALARAWGGGDVASADGMRFAVPVRTVHAAPNPKCFGMGRGVTWYNLLSDQRTGLNAITVPGTLRGSLVLLAAALEQQTELQPTRTMTGTGAYSDVVFGLFRLLGYRFSPRLADIGGTRFRRVDPGAGYGELNGWARQRVNLGLIATHWDGLLRLAGSLKLGRVPASGTMRALQSGCPTQKRRVPCPRRGCCQAFAIWPWAYQLAGPLFIGSSRICDTGRTSTATKTFTRTPSRFAVPLLPRPLDGRFFSCLLRRKRGPDTSCCFA
jgi:hypothetical protein